MYDIIVHICGNEGGRDLHTHKTQAQNFGITGVF